MLQSKVCWRMLRTNTTTTATTYCTFDRPYFDQRFSFDYRGSIPRATALDINIRVFGAKRGSVVWKLTFLDS